MAWWNEHNLAINTKQTKEMLTNFTEMVEWVTRVKNLFNVNKEYFCPNNVSSEKNRVLKFLRSSRYILTTVLKGYNIDLWIIVLFSSCTKAESWERVVETGQPPWLVSKDHTYTTCCLSGAQKKSGVTSITSQAQHAHSFYYSVISSEANGWTLANLPSPIITYHKYNLRRSYKVA